MSDDRRKLPIEPTEKGIPQGGVISSLLANIYLHHFDAEMTRRGYPMVRYVDDFVVFARSKRKAERVLEVIRDLHPEKTEITNFGRGFTFLGYEFIAWRYKRSRKTLTRLKDRVREVTRRQQPWPVDRIIARLNAVIRGWGNERKCEKTSFGRLDKWIRRRLRVYMENKTAVKHQNRRIPNKVLRDKRAV